MRSLIIPRLLRHASGIKRREPFMPRVHSRMFKKATVSPARPGTPRRAFPGVAAMRRTRYDTLSL